MSGKLRVAVIGCGVIAPTHVESYQRVADVEVVWACDLVEEKARTLAAKYGIPNVGTDYKKIVKRADVDAVSVCTDHGSHGEIAVAALKAGKHVLCEKALTAAPKDLDKMFAAHAKRPELVFGGVFQHRFDSAYRYLKKLVDEKAFGTILTAGVQIRLFRSDDYYRSGDGWRGTWKREGGAVLINQAIHNVDVLNWVMGGVAAVGGAYANLSHQGVIETEDTVVAALRFRCGALGYLEATSGSHHGWEATVAVHGTEGAVELRNTEPLKISFKDSAREAEVKQAFQSCHDQKKIQSGKDYYGPSHPALVADFCAAVREQRPPYVTAASARHTVDLVQAVYQSQRKGRWIELPADHLI